MPEGDTVHTIAAVLGHWLTGRRLDAVWVRGQLLSELTTRQVVAVTSRGKHLFIDLDDGQRLRSHLGLYGAWHHYNCAEPWQKPRHQASLVLEAEGRVYVCFNAREIERMRTQGFRDLDLRRHLGPDLTREAFDPGLLWDRTLALLPRDTPIVDLLLDQRVAAGIGNVYKSEVLFVTRRSPLLRLDDLSYADFGTLYRTAGDLLNGNLSGGPRRTRPSGAGQDRLWVYGRAGQPCLCCGTPVRRDRLGRSPRSTHWCPVCQGSAHSSGLVEEVPKGLGE